MKPILLTLLFAAAVGLLLGARKPLPAEGAKIAGRPDATGASKLRTEKGGKPITWITIGEAAAKLQQEKKPVLIDLYTTWCGWCKQMDRRTYSNKHVAEYLSDKFYTVKLDAETHDVLSWGGKTYGFDPQYRCNLLAVYLSHGRLEFPTTVIVVAGYEPQAIPGYMEPKDLEMLVKFFGEGAYRTQGFDEYQKTFRRTW